MSNKQWGHGFFTGLEEGYQEGRLDGWFDGYDAGSTNPSDSSDYGKIIVAGLAFLGGIATAILTGINDNK